MDAKQTRKLINGVGGDVAFAKLLGIDSQEGFQQRVNNWKRRGMPTAIELEHYETLKKLRAPAKGPQTSPDSFEAA
jgi:hypothetical protein